MTGVQTCALPISFGMSNIKSNLKLLILAVAIVAVWRGVWGLMDIYLFPNNEILSFSISIIIGVLILYFHESFPFSVRFLRRFYS